VDRWDPDRGKWLLLERGQQGNLITVDIQEYDSIRLLPDHHHRRGLPMTEELDPLPGPASELVSSEKVFTESVTHRGADLLLHGLHGGPDHQGGESTGKRRQRTSERVLVRSKKGRERAVARSTFPTARGHDRLRSPLYNALPRKKRSQRDDEPRVGT